MILDTVAIKSTIGQCIRRYRERAGITQAELGKAIGRAGQTVYSLENGRQWAEYETLEAIAKHLGFPVDHLFASEIVMVKPTPEEALAVLAESLAAKKTHPQADLFAAIEGATPGQIKTIREALGLADQREDALKKR